MEREAMMSRRVVELEHQLESARRESQDRVAEAIGAQAVELLVAEQATAAEVHLAETKEALQKSLKALESERKARSKAV